MVLRYYLNIYCNALLNIPYIEGSIDGMNHRGRPRLEYIQQIIKDQGCNSYVDMKRKADDREEWKMAANQSTDRNHRENS